MKLKTARTRDGMKDHLTCLLLAIAIPPHASAAGCSLVKVSPVRIEKTIDAIATIKSKHTVKLYGADDNEGRGPTLHEGPLEVMDAVGLPICKAYIDLPKPPFMFGLDNYLYLRAGDAIDVAIYVIDLDTCKTVWQSKAYESDNPPDITSTALIIDRKKIALKANCLPAQPSPVKG